MANGQNDQGNLIPLPEEQDTSAVSMPEIQGILSQVPPEVLDDMAELLSDPNAPEEELDGMLDTLQEALVQAGVPEEALPEAIGMISDAILKMADEEELMSEAFSGTGVGGIDAGIGQLPEEAGPAISGTGAPPGGPGMGL
jgi:hypothetical protein